MIGQYTKTGPKQRLQHSNDLGTIKKKKKRKPKTTWRHTVEKKRVEAGWQSWEEAKTVAAN